MNRDAQLAKRYGDVADAYDRVWAPPLLHLARPMLDALRIQTGEQVVDLGAGTGAIAETLGALCVDRTAGMLAVALRKGLDAVAADARRLPLRDACADVVVSTFVLQHIPTPGVVAREARRILRAGGRYGTATWSPEHGEAGGVYDLLDDVFADGGVPTEQVPMKTWHDRVDDPSKMQRFARRAGFASIEAWTQNADYRWTVESFFTWATSMGPYGRRFSRLEPERRAAVGEALRLALERAPADAFVWRVPIVCCVARV